MYIFHLLLVAPLSYFKWYLLENAYCIYIKIQLILSNRTYIGLAEIFLWIFSKDAMEKNQTNILTNPHFTIFSFNFFLLSLYLQYSKYQKWPLWAYLTCSLTCKKTFSIFLLLKITICFLKIIIIGFLLLFWLYVNFIILTNIHFLPSLISIANK